MNTTTRSFHAVMHGFIACVSLCSFTLSFSGCASHRPSRHLAALPIAPAEAPPASITTDDDEARELADSTNEIPPTFPQDDRVLVRFAEYVEVDAMPSHEPVVHVASRIASDDVGVLHSKPTESPETQYRPDETIYPIDLANALQLSGASDLQVRMARERVCQAQADLLQARALWLPTLRFGVGWNKHDGRLQRTEGEILEISRNSLYFGGGLGLGEMPLAGGAAGPSRLMVNLSIADAIFAPRVAQNLVASAASSSRAVFNDALLEVSNSYFDLLQVHGRLANSQIAMEALEGMVELTMAFERAGSATMTEVDRARTQWKLQQREVRNRFRQSKTISAQLVRQLQLEPTMTVVPVEERVLPIEIVDADLPLSELIATGLANRPETRAQQTLVWAAGHSANQEHWRPWLPNVQVGATVGSFGGGQSTQFDNQSGRSDIDLLAVWELQNLGLGNRALRQRTCSVKREASLRARWIRDQIESEIVAAANNVASYREQIGVSSEAAEAARETYQLNLQKIREGEGLPIELLQAITSLVDSLDAYVDAVSDYNRAQFQLVHSLGQPPSAPATETGIFPESN